MSPALLARRVIKAAALPFGALQPAREEDVVILVYHRVGTGDREIDLDAEAFRGQMAYLSSGARVTSLDAALDGAGGIVVTIDDGYRDFQDHVVPVLDRYRVPAVLYLATGLVTNGNPSTEALTWSQIREAVSTGLVTVAAHTHSHAYLSHVSEAVAADEMRRSQALIEDNLGMPCMHFAYPWGVAGPPAERAARRLFRSAALMWRTNRAGRLEPYRLGRTPVLRSDGQRFFRAKARGLLDHEALAYRVLRRGPWRQS